MTTEPKSPLSYLGIAETNPPDVSFMNRAPLTTDYKQWYLGDIVIDVVARKAFIMTGKTATSGTWTAIAVSDFSITGNAGGQVEPDPTTFNLFLLGTATNGINIVGDPATYTLTVGLQSPYSDGNFRFSNNLYVGDAATGTNNLEITSADATKTGLSIVDTGGGDPYLYLGIDGAATYSVGPDNSDADTFKITDGATPSLGNTLFSLTIAGAGAFLTTLTAAGLIDTTRTPNAVSVYGVGGALAEVGPLADGELVIGSAGNAPVAANITAGAGIIIANGAGTITISAPGGEHLITNLITDAAANITANEAYVTDRATLVTLTLPAVAAFGDIIEVTNIGVGGVRIAQNAGQTIYTGNLASTTGVAGYIEFINRYTTVKLQCVVANNDFVIFNGYGGNWTVA